MAITQSHLVVAEGEIGRDGLACMTVKVKPPPAMQSSATTCGSTSPRLGAVGVYTPLEPLPPPVIIEPVFECQSTVGLSGLLPGASVEIFVTDAGGVTASLGTFCACTSRVDANVGRHMKPGDRIKATQSMINDRWQCGLRGKESPDVAVVPPDSHIKPKIEEKVYEGDPVLHVTNQIEGGTITLLSRASLSDPEEEIGSRPSSRFPEVPLPKPRIHAGQVLRIKQELCGVEEFSDAVVVQGPPPKVDPPKVRKPLFGCGQIVVVDDVLPGATVYIRQTLPYLLPPLSPEYPIGQKWSTGTSVQIEVFPALNPGANVTAYQKVGSILSDRAPWVPATPRTDLLPPTIEGPVKVGDTSVWLSGVVPGAHLRVFNRGTPVGSGSLPGEDGGLGLWWAVPDGAILTATQALCQGESRPSPPRPAVRGAPCEGPLAFNPGKWNVAPHQGCNNCYNYACDIQTDNFAQPGGGVSEVNCNDVGKAAISDGLHVCTTGHCHPCHHRVALVINPGIDYHWYRQGADGLWTHKRGCQAAKDVDESNNPITDPSTADRGPYSNFCGYFCVYKPEVSISGPGCNC
ncbi:hypothetical protein [Variovorax ginsengisoli]|uniref:Uncharacterized protein n=1 Tax=Variovorax ginsengisoli TaxID=363844 RepID=A0ABT8S9P2_9BURK|nr:hypothetical protein [Variovorax ginsengisoli]MDN8616459.1 hypothetical protein [Variovorax ginsengisoli]MDO1535629.1 hypothetical protein [Variovorax ginsengisoli]